jgi:hypothetical protein
MVLSSQGILIPIPRSSPQLSVTVNGDNLTSRVYESEFKRPATIGIGTFTLKLANAGGINSGKYSAGQTVIFSAGYQSATQKFAGRIDFIKDTNSKDGQFLEMEGRHAAWRLSEIKVFYQATDVDCSTILMNIFSLFAPEFSTAAYVETSGVPYTCNWQGTTFWDCVRELCIAAGADCRVDDSLAVHFFAKDSKVNDADYIFEGSNFKETKEWGTDKFYEKTRAIVSSTDDSGLPVLYTAKNGIDNALPEVDVRETYMNDSNLSSAGVKTLAQATLASNVNRPPQGVILCKGLDNAQPGEDIQVFVYRQQIFAYYRIVQITDKFGRKNGGWTSEVTLEVEGIGTLQLLEQSKRTENKLALSDNPNKMGYSANFTFSDSTDTAAMTGCKVADGALSILGGVVSGTWASITTNLPVSPGSFEMRLVGQYLGISTFAVTFDGGITSQAIPASGVLYAVATTGTLFKLSINLRSDTDNPNPSVDSVAILYKE